MELISCTFHCGRKLAVRTNAICARGLMQVLLFVMVSAEAWTAAILISYYYSLSLIYGFGTLVVAFNSSAEFALHTVALEQLRMDHVANCYLGWGSRSGDDHKRVLDKDICLMAKEVRHRCNVQPDTAHERGPHVIWRDLHDCAL